VRIVPLNVRTSTTTPPSPFPSPNLQTTKSEKKSLILRDLSLHLRTSIYLNSPPAKMKRPPIRQTPSHYQ
ncbi:hypothetical protein VIGAN_01421000, partial [Vigna angularis var. angularis]